MTDTTPGLCTRPRFWKPVLWGGALAGTCDLAFALLFYGAHGAPPLRIMQSIAGGLLGREAARAGGLPTALLGVTLHYLIACIWAALFVAASRRIPPLARYPLVVGPLYGLIVYLGMNMIVLPLSALHPPAWPPPLALWPIMIHLLGIGPPIAVAARVFSCRQLEA